MIVEREVTFSVTLTESEHEDCVECLRGMVVVLDKQRAGAAANDRPTDDYTSTIAALEHLLHQIAPRPVSRPPRLRIVRALR